MSVEREDLPGEDAQLGWRERIEGVAEAALALGRTRLLILRVEAAAKASLLVKGVLGIAVAAGLGAGALLLLAALLAAILTRLFGSVILGVLGALVLYGAGAAVGAVVGWKALSRVRPFQFPEARRELARDWEALRASWSLDEGAQEGETGPAGSDSRTREAALENLEERFRAGAE